MHNKCFKNHIIEPLEFIELVWEKWRILTVAADIRVNLFEAQINERSDGTKPQIN